MNARLITWGAAALLAVLALPVHAAIDYVYIRSLVESSQMKEAYEYGSAHIKEGAGKPAFDLYFGIAAIDSGHPDQGVLALERVLQKEPKNHLARLEMARGYFILDEYARARREFEYLLDTEPPANVETNIRRYLDAIRLKEGRFYTNSTAYLDLAGGYDSNAASAPEDNLINTQHGVVTLNDSDTSADDAFAGVGAGGQIDAQLANAWSAYAGADLYARRYSEETDYSYYTLEGQAGLSYRADRHRYRLGLRAQRFTLDTGWDRDLLGLELDWRYRMSKTTQTQLFAQRGTLTYSEDELRDATFYSLGAGITHQGPGVWSPLWFATISLGHDDPDDSSREARAYAERDYGWLRGGVQLQTSSRLGVIGAVTWQTSRYGARDPVFDETREDDYLSADLTANYLLNRDWTARLGLVHTENTSNLEVYEYDRTQLQLGLRYSF